MLSEKNFSSVSLALHHGYAVLSLNRPDTLNALSSSVLQEMSFALDHLYEAINASQVRVLIITGSDRSFVAGADIAEMRSFSETQAHEFSLKGAAVFRKIETLPIPVIAAVNGFCLGGGCELALACDIRLASDKAKFGQPEVNLGLIPGFSGTQRLPRTIGMQRAKELIYSGRVIKSDEALQIGLVMKVVPHETLLDEAVALAQSFASRAPLAVQAAKRAINEGADLPIPAAIEKECILFAKCFNTDEHNEGMDAFLQKRAPQF